MTLYHRWRLLVIMVRYLNHGWTFNFRDFTERGKLIWDTTIELSGCSYVLKVTEISEP